MVADPYRWWYKILIIWAALLNETYLLNNGTSISPMAPQADGQGGPQKSLREIVSQIDNDKDLHTYVMSFASKVVSKPLETKYERHPVGLNLSALR